VGAEVGASVAAAAVGEGDACAIADADVCTTAGAGDATDPAVVVAGAAAPLVPHAVARQIRQVSSRLTVDTLSPLPREPRSPAIRSSFLYSQRIANGPKRGVLGRDVHGRQRVIASSAIAQRPEAR
jgi:hypothetical protein